MKIAIVDYGSGNLRSVSKAIEKIAPISTQVLVTGDPEEVLKADRVVFPGQGAMPDCMKNLRTTGMEEAVRDAIRNKPFFAVCVGEQMLFEHSEEGDTPGLGIFPGDVVRFASDRVDQTGARLKVPQMGWNQVTQTREHPMWNGHQRCLVLFCSQLLRQTDRSRLDRRNDVLRRGSHRGCRPRQRFCNAVPS